MKQKLMIKLIAVITIVATLLGGCGFLGETKIEYERLVKALDEGDMATVMSAGEDGYARVIEEVIFSTYEDKEDGEHKKVVYQTTDGIYNTREKIFYGNTVQNIVTDILNEEDPTSRENYNKERMYEANIMYTDGGITSSNPNVDISYIVFLLDRLQGIGKLTPSKDTKGGSEPNGVAYELTEKQFQELFNNKLNIEYDEFDSSYIVLSFDSAKGSATLPMSLLEIDLGVSFSKTNAEGKSVLHNYQVSYSFSSKEWNEGKAKDIYNNYKQGYGMNE